jgi:hypothetical protein
METQIFHHAKIYLIFRKKKEKRKKVEQQVEKSPKEVHLHPYTFHHAITKSSIIPLFALL